jgi:hypothetical protein
MVGVESAITVTPADLPHVLLHVAVVEGMLVELAGISLECAQLVIATDEHGPR